MTLLLAGGVEFGRMMFAANALQDVARVTARELAVAPIRGAATFEYALSCDPGADPNCLADLRRRVFDPACLVIDFSDPAVAADPAGYLAVLPVANRTLRPLMIADPARPNLLRYPGALLSDTTATPCSAIGPNGQAAATGFTVGIPLITDRASSGVETIVWVPVVEEIRAIADLECPARGPFSIIYLATADECGALSGDPQPDRGLAAVRVNYPFQSAMLSAFRPAVPTEGDPLPPNWGNPIQADDASVEELNAAPGGVVDDGVATGPYAGAFGLGRQYAMAGMTVRPFRRLVSAQAVFRREVIQ